jgi:hypothetical protein
MSEAAIRRQPVISDNPLIGLLGGDTFDSAKAKAQVLQRIANDAIVHEYAAHCKGKPKGFRKCATVADVLARRAIHVYGLFDLPELDPTQIRQRTGVAVLAEASIPYLWDADLFRLAAGGELPPHLLSKSLPFDILAHVHGAGAPA